MRGSTIIAGLDPGGGGVQGCTHTLFDRNSYSAFMCPVHTCPVHTSTYQSTSPVQSILVTPTIINQCPDFNNLIYIYTIS